MKEENLLALIKELSEMDTLHKEYLDEDIHYVIDATREGDTLTFTVQIEEDNDKKEFEAWASQFDDELFTEIWESLSNKYNLKDLNKVYESKDYHKVISLFRKEANEIISKKIASLQQLIG